MKLPTCSCGCPARFCIRWRSPIMRASAFWYDCGCLLRRSLAILDRPGMVVTVSNL